MMGAPMDPTSIASRCLAVLKEGPATSGEVAAEIGVTSKNAGTHLRNLHLRGKVARNPFNKPSTTARGPRRVWLWSAA